MSNKLIFWWLWGVTLTVGRPLPNPGDPLTFCLAMVIVRAVTASVCMVIASWRLK